MCPSYARIRLPLAEAMARFGEWIGHPPLEPPKKLKWNQVVDAACEGDAWRSLVAVFIYESGEWTVFEDQSGHLASFSAEEWRRLARSEDFVLAGYNDAVPYGQLIVIQGGRIVRDFLDDEQEPAQNVNRGKLPTEKQSPIKTWIDAASFVDEDEIVSHPDTGLLWMFGKMSAGDKS
jgi:hypothetical protein